MIPQEHGQTVLFFIVGAYLPGWRNDLCRGTKEDYLRALENIGRVVRSEADPVFGAGAVWVSIGEAASNVLLMRNSLSLTQPWPDIESGWPLIECIAT